MPNKQAHLEMIQGVINRLSHNSFLLKGWSVILVSGLFALAAKDADVRFLYLTYLPAIAFWCLDGYFLRQERLYRKLYDHVRRLSKEGIDFSMNTGSVSAQVKPWICVAASSTLLAFHGILVVAISVVTILSLCAGE